MATKTLTINGTTYPFKPGYTTTRHLNSTLDIAYVIIPQQAEFAVEPLDEVSITDGTTTTYYYVSTIRRKIASFTPSKTWNYEIGLVSPTIRLQRVILPNRGITQRFRSSQLTIYEKLQQYVTVYAPWATLSEALQAKTDSVTCPEMQWTQPTLFEVFNDLLAVVGCVVTMPTYTTISVLDLTETGSAIDESKLNNIEVFQSLDEYASKLEIDAKNAVYPETNIQTYEKLVLKTTQARLMTVDNAELILAKPVYSIDKMEVIFYDDVNAVKQTLDITSHVVEKTVYDSYKASSVLTVIDDLDYKRNAIYYTEGSNIISGFGFNEDGILGIDTRRAINNIITSELGLSPLQLTASDVFEMGFKVWYTSTEDVKFRVSRDGFNESVMINNQETSHTDLRALAKNNQDVLNRISNPAQTIFGRYTSLAEIPTLGDTMDDYILTSVTVRHHVDYYEMSAVLTENYVLDNMFTAIKNRKRYQQYASASQAFLSEHITEYNILVTTASDSNYSSFEQFLVQIAKESYRLKAIRATMLFANNNYVDVVLNHSSHWLGTNAVRVNIKMDDNYSAGLRLEKETIFLVASRYSVVNTPYVDENGEFEALQLLLYKEFNNPNFAIDDNIFSDEALDRARNLPLIDPALELYGDDVIFDTDLLYRYKDNREITSETLQFYFKPDSHIIIGDAFYRHNPLVYQGESDIPLYVYYSTSEIYEDGDQIAKGTLYSEIFRSGNGILSTGSQTAWNLLGIVSWCVADINGNMYIAVNGNQRRIYLVSEYSYNPVNYDITDVLFETVYNVTSAKANDEVIEDIDIYAISSYAYQGGEDKRLNDIDISTTYSVVYESALDYTIDDIDIYALHNADYTKGEDYAVEDIDIYTLYNSTPINGNDYLIDDIDIYTLYNEMHDYSFTEDNNWVYIGSSGTANVNYTYFSGGNFCSGVSVITSWINATYNPNSAAVGTIARVTQTAVGITCSPPYYYYEVEAMVYE